MGAALLITLREGLEISLVLAVMAAYLVKTDRSKHLRQMWFGAGVAAVVSVATGLLFKQLVGEFEGKWEQAIEGVLALFAVGILTWMIFWMRQNAREHSEQLRSRVDAALERSPMALAAVAFVAVLREGFETAIFLLGAETGSSSGSRVVIGGLIGLAIAAVLGFAMYSGSYRIDLKLFFQVTGLMLILFAAGLFAKSLHEFRELFDIEWEPIAARVWDITSGPFAEGSTLHDFLKGLFGWSPHPERIRVLGYFAYLIPVTWFFFRGDSRPTPKQPISGAESANSPTVSSNR